jgi:hypothetical protein
MALERWVPTDQACRMLGGISRHRFWFIMRQHGIRVRPCVFGRQSAITESDLRALMKRRRREMEDPHRAGGRPWVTEEQ